jgi:hypothetical protein
VGIWQANNLDEESQLAHLDAWSAERSFIDRSAPATSTPRTPRRTTTATATATPSMPLITVESADEVAVELSPRTRRVSAAAKVYKDG